MFSTKTATINNTEFSSPYMPVGINENVSLESVEVRRSPQGKNFIEFVFVDDEGRKASFTEWKNEKNLWVKTDEDLQNRDNLQFGRILQLINCYTSNVEFEANSFGEMIEWVANTLNKLDTTKKLRLKVVYDKKGYTKVSSLGVYVEPMDVEESQIKIWKNDLLERPVVADKESDNDPLSDIATPDTTVQSGADDLPF